MLNAIQHIVRSPLGSAVARPWVDRLTLWALRRIFMPSSRLWAAAEVAGLDGERFCVELGLHLRPRQMRRLDKALGLAARRRAAADRVDADWDAVFFGGRAAEAAVRAALEAERRQARHAYNSARALFRFLLFEDIPVAKRRLVGPDEVDGIYGGSLQDPAALFRPADTPPTVSRSPSIEIGDTRHYWLRFPSPYPRLGDLVYAHVYEPVAVDNPPTVILGHGICVEFDHWQGLLDEAAVLCRQGMRVVRPEAPFHGRRRPVGYYGGEWITAESPLSVLDTFVGAVHERAVLIDWCRRQDYGPVAIGGSSLGAMMAIVTAEYAHDWPAALRPDGLIMITQCERPIDALIGGSIARLFGSEASKRDSGWTDDLLQRYLSILEPKRGPVMPAERIVGVLGRYDTATPFAGGKALHARWQVSAENSFIWPCGHFTVPIRLARDPAPLRRFADLMARAA